MELFDLTLLTLVAVITSAVSAIIGMGGGILLLAAMLVVFPDLLIVVPLHGVVQLTSNTTRVYAFRSHLVSWISGSYFIGSFIGIALACLLLVWIQKVDLERIDPWLKLLVSLYILVMLFKSKGKKEAVVIKKMGFALLGVVIIPISTLLGATGPLLAPFFIRQDLVKQQVIVNKAACQVITHVMKLAAFSGVTYFSFQQYYVELISLALAAVVGTYVGKSVIDYVNENLFRKLYKSALCIAGLKILIFDSLVYLL